MTLSSDHKALVERLHAEADRLDRRAFSDRCMSPECALASNLAEAAASAITTLSDERDACVRQVSEEARLRGQAEYRAIAAERERDEAREHAAKRALDIVTLGQLATSHCEEPDPDILREMRDERLDLEKEDERHATRRTSLNI